MGVDVLRGGDIAQVMLEVARDLQGTRAQDTVGVAASGDPEAAVQPTQAAHNMQWAQSILHTVLPVATTQPAAPTMQRPPIQSTATIASSTATPVRASPPPPYEFLPRHSPSPLYHTHHGSSASPCWYCLSCDKEFPSAVDLVKHYQSDAHCKTLQTLGMFIGERWLLLLLLVVVMVAAHVNVGGASSGAGDDDDQCMFVPPHHRQQQASVRQQLLTQQRVQLHAVCHQGMLGLCVGFFWSCCVCSTPLTCIPTITCTCHSHSRAHCSNTSGT